MVSYLRFCVLVVALSPAGGCAGRTTSGGMDFVPRPGDLLFQDLDTGPLCEAIEEVTFGCHGSKFTHVGIASDDSGIHMVLEAVSEGVTLTPLDAFLARSRDAMGQPKVVVGRLRPAYRHLIRPALKYGLRLRGKSYDKVFEIGNEAYYCSELVYEMFAYANGGKAVFELQPMTFKETVSDRTFAVWMDYFRELGVVVPEGQPGINPGAISRSPRIDIVHVYGKPDGWVGRQRANHSPTCPRPPPAGLGYATQPVRMFSPPTRGDATE